MSDRKTGDVMRAAIGIVVLLVLLVGAAAIAVARQGPESVDDDSYDGWWRR